MLQTVKWFLTGWKFQKFEAANCKKQIFQAVILRRVLFFRPSVGIWRIQWIIAM